MFDKPDSPTLRPNLLARKSLPSDEVKRDIVNTSKIYHKDETYPKHLVPYTTVPLEEQHPTVLWLFAGDETTV